MILNKDKNQVTDGKREVRILEKAEQLKIDDFAVVYKISAL